MRAALKKLPANDQNLQFIQDAVQAALDQVNAYQPKTPANWASPPPATIPDALDRIAALLKTLNTGNPIP